MPHIAVKLFPGRTEDQKRRLAAAFSRSVRDILDCDETYVSVSFEDVAPEQWKSRVFEGEILARPDLLVQRPGYEP